MMTIGFKLNGNEVSIQTNPERRLVNVLREDFGLMGAKTGCFQGTCGACTILVGRNGREDVVKSCLVPVFKARDTEIITIEGMITLHDDYEDIIQGFAEAGVESCGFCETAKILSTQALFSRLQSEGKFTVPSREDILAAFLGIKCRCTDPDSLVQGVIAAAKLRERRLYG
jgi:carbon-monoxide dehydrogenase small subunit